MISSTSDRRVAARRRAWGRGPAILRFDSLEARGLMAVSFATLPDLVATQFASSGNYDWDDLVHVQGTIANNGGGPTLTASRADIYVSASPKLDGNAVRIGSVNVPAGLGSGQTVKIDQDVRLPPTAIPKIGVDGLVYVQLRVDADNVIPEQNKINNVGQGQGYDTSVVYIVPRRSSALRSTSFAIGSPTATWGGSISVTGQVNNNAAGDAPATRARVVLTPNGFAPGTGYDYTVGDIAVPSVSGYSTVNIQQALTLPTVVPLTIAGYAKYNVSISLDADFTANVMYPHTTTQGLGIDAAAVTITGGSPSPTSSTTDAKGVVSTVTALPDLASAGVQVPTGPVAWGDTFQVSTSVQNLGAAEAGPFDIRFILVGPNGALNYGVNLGTVHVAGLAANNGQDIVASVRLPGRLPAGVNLSSGGSGRVVAIVDLESRVDELFHNNNTSFSAPMALRVIGRDGNSTVPTQSSGNVAVTATQTTSTSTVRTPSTIGKNAGVVAINAGKARLNRVLTPTPAGTIAPKAGPGSGNKNGTIGRPAKSRTGIGSSITKSAKSVGNAFKKLFHI